MVGGREARGREWLWMVPAIVLAASYFHICWYHATWNPISTIVHEGGKLTLWETTLYASHFLGHVPVLVVLALWLRGSWTPVSGPEPWPAAVRLLLFLLFATVLSLTLFGTKDTLDFVLQRKQSEAVYGEGGSWNLHLPSTMLLFFLIPAFVSATRRVAGLPRREGNGIGWFLAGWVLVVTVTMAVNGSFLGTVARVWTSPRYLAHSVRELLTSPLILFPPALYWLVRQSEETQSSGSVDRWSRWETGSLAVFTAGAILQASVALMVTSVDASQTKAITTVPFRGIQDRSSPQGDDGGLRGTEPVSLAIVVNPPPRNSPSLSPSGVGRGGGCRKRAPGVPRFSGC